MAPVDTCGVVEGDTGGPWRSRVLRKFQFATLFARCFILFHQISGSQREKEKDEVMHARWMDGYRDGGRPPTLLLLLLLFCLPGLPHLPTALGEKEVKKYENVEEDNISTYIAS